MSLFTSNPEKLCSYAADIVRPIDRLRTAISPGLSLSFL
jgi:hypothetical protein